jgi:hypothetical protein
MRSTKLAAPARNWLRQPAMTTTDVSAFGTGRRGDYGARSGVAHPSPN